VKTFFCKLIGPRATFPADMTPEEGQAMQRHVAYWRSWMEKGSVVVFGPVADPAGTYGMLILEVEDESAARAMLEGDPVIQAKIGFRFEMHPMPRGAIHPPFQLSAS
jgi:uncharacterized protein YciI